MCELGFLVSFLVGFIIIIVFFVSIFFPLDFFHSTSSRIYRARARPSHRWRRRRRWPLSVFRRKTDANTKRWPDRIVFVSCTQKNSTIRVLTVRFPFHPCWRFAVVDGKPRNTKIQRISLRESVRFERGQFEVGGAGGKVRVIRKTENPKNYVRTFPKKKVFRLLLIAALPVRIVLASKIRSLVCFRQIASILYNVLVQSWKWEGRGGVFSIFSSVRWSSTTRTILTVDKMSESDKYPYTSESLSI